MVGHADSDLSSLDIIRRRRALFCSYELQGWSVKSETNMMMTPTGIIWRWLATGNRCLPAHSGHVASCAGWKADHGVITFSVAVLSGSTGGWKCVQAYAVILKQAHLLFLVFIDSFIHSLIHSFIHWLLLLPSAFWKLLMVPECFLRYRPSWHRQLVSSSTVD